MFDLNHLPEGSIKSSSLSLANSLDRFKFGKLLYASHMGIHSFNEWCHNRVVKC